MLIHNVTTYTLDLLPVLNNGFGQPNGMFGYMDYYKNMLSQLLFQVPTTFTAFTSQQNMFFATSNMFGIFTHALLSNDHAF